VKRILELRVKKEGGLETMRSSWSLFDGFKSVSLTHFEVRFVVEHSVESSEIESTPVNVATDDAFRVRCHG
jgi:hypothetical protein